MTVKLEKQAIPYTLIVTTEADTVKRLIEEEFEKIKDQVQVKGFRKGQATRAVFESQKFFDKFTHYRGVINKCFEMGVSENNIDVVDSKDYQIIGDFSDKSPLVIKASVYLSPKVEQFDIARVKVEKLDFEVTDAMVTEELDARRKAAQTFTMVEDQDYLIKTNDVLEIDFVGTIDKKPFQGGTAKNFKYTVGETTFIPGFEVQLLAMKYGQSSVVSVTFPDDYNNKDLKGKSAEFDVKLNAIQSCSRPEVSDLAAKQDLDVPSFLASVKDKMRADKELVNAEQLRSLVLRKCVEVTDVEPIPDSLVTSELESEWSMTLKRMGMSEEQAAKSGMMSKNQFFTYKRRDAETLIRSKVILNYVAKEQGLDISDEELKNYAVSRIREMGKEDEMQKLIDENLNNPYNKHILVSSLKQEKAMDWIFGHCTIE